MTASVPANECERWEALRRHKILDTLAEPAFDDITLLTARFCETPIALISLVDTDRQWFKSQHGLEVAETPRDASLCAHALLNPREVLIVEDARRDSRFADSALVTGPPHIVFYAGTPLVTADGFALGTLCVMDYHPRQLTPPQIEALRALGRQVMALLAMRLREAEMQEAHERLLRLATTDGLTALKNHRAFQERLDQEFQRARRYKTPLSLVMLDLDRLKRYNDQFGHPAGDDLMKAVAQVLKTKARETDFVARYGGEEFAIILPGTNETEAVAAAERLRAAIAVTTAEATPDGSPVTASFGVATNAPDMIAKSDLLRAADRALYRSKHTGRNRVTHDHKSD